MTSKQFTELLEAVKRLEKNWTLDGAFQAELLLTAYEDTGDHNHGSGRIAPGVLCPGGDCLVARARAVIAMGKPPTTFETILLACERAGMPLSVTEQHLYTFARPEHHTGIRSVVWFLTRYMTPAQREQRAEIVFKDYGKK